MQRARVALQRKRIVVYLVNNLLRDRTLAVECINHQ
ncbi:MAG: hypothetical protein QOF90_310 [Acetobacteraceae bacterium]|nr:hypothetical protein [Acetobacteraceae bacterium]MEA2774904.1 hypothetical protein [Acetobacteraceae bacterium]